MSLACVKLIQTYPAQLVIQETELGSEIKDGRFFISVFVCVWLS